MKGLTKNPLRKIVDSIVNGYNLNRSNILTWGFKNHILTVTGKMWDILDLANEVIPRNLN